MSDERAPSATNRARVRIHEPRLAGIVLGRVVGMLAARAAFPVDRLEEALLLTDAIGAHAPSHATNGTTEVLIITDDEGLELRVTSLRAGAAQDLLADAVLPSVGNVFERVADAVHEEGGELVLRLAVPRNLTPEVQA